VSYRNGNTPPPDPRDLDTEGIAREISEFAMPMFKSTRFPVDTVFQLTDIAREQLDPLRKAIVSLSDRLDAIDGA
jgi:hypothetical protein